MAPYKVTQGAFVAGQSRQWSDYRVPLLKTPSATSTRPPGAPAWYLAESENPPDAGSATQLTILLNFFDELRRLTK